MSATRAPPTSVSSPQKRRGRLILLVTVAVVLLGLNLAVWVRFPEKELSPTSESDPEPSFSGSSAELQHTIFVPTLQSRMPKNKSALWCATLPLAFQQLEKDVVRGPIELEGAGEVSRDLSRTPPAELAAEHYYVAAGFYKDGILERIRRELSARFPKAPLPGKDPHLFKLAMAYAYLEVALLYEFQFKDSEEPLAFKDSRGQETPVHAFGIRKSDADKGVKSFRSQVQVLFRKGKEFAVDLSRNTQPYQIVLARMDRKTTLQATLEDLNKRLAEGKPDILGDATILLVPNMNWRVEHRFRELEGKTILSPGFRKDTFFSLVSQFIQFKMDRKGATIASGARINVAFNGHEAGPEVNFIFDRPFLIVLKKRDRRQPFFVMWVDNAELLQRWSRK